MKKNLRFKRYFNDPPVVTPPVVPPVVTPPVVPPVVTPPANDKDKIFTQAEVNTIVAEDRRKIETKHKETIAQLDALRTQANLTQTQRDELQAQIDQLQAQYLTKEELAKQERDKEIKKTMETAKKNEEEAKRWKGDYTRLSIDNAIINAATTNKAFSNEQMVTFLTPITALEPELDTDGKATGRTVPIVTLTDKDKDGKEIILKLPVNEAVKKMKEIPERFGNLFQIEGAGGIGAQNYPGSGTAVDSEFRPDFTPEQYRAWRIKKGLDKRPGVKRS